MTFCDFVRTLGTLYSAAFPSKVYGRVNGNCQSDDVTVARLYIGFGLALVNLLRGNLNTAF